MDIAPYQIPKKEILSKASQAMVVLTNDTGSVEGTFYLFQKDMQGKWQMVGMSFPALVGKAGMVYGDGILSFSAEIKKREGDHKTPMGIYGIREAFGYSNKETADLKVRYIQCTPALKCVDDPSSQYYNQIVDEQEVTKDWDSAEDMLREDHLYKWGLVIDYNKNPVVPGLGSCIFLHIFRTPQTATEGCTAVDEKNLIRVLKWLEPARNPIFIAFPRNLYKQIYEDLELPKVI